MTTTTTLIANQQFTDSEGQQHTAGEVFEVKDQQQAEKLIREGKARRQEEKSGSQSQKGRDY